MNGVDTIKDLGQGLWRSSATNKSPPGQISFSSWHKHWLWWPPSFPSHSHLGTLCCLYVPVVSCPRSPQHVPYHQLPWDILRSSVRKEGAGSRDSEEGLGAVTGLMNLVGKKAEILMGVKAIGWQNVGRGSGWLPPTMESAEVSWLTARGFGCLVSC